MNNKRFICLLLALVIMISSLGVVSFVCFADDIDPNGAYKFTNSTGTLEIFNDSVMIDRNEKTASNYPWYSYKAAVEHVIVHPGVTKISAYAFCRQDNLLDIQIPDSVTSIGEAALAGNNSLKEVTISDNVAVIGNYAFGFDEMMGHTDGFSCNCSAASYAQKWCLQNYVPFNTPFPDSGTASAVISTSGVPAFWSFVPSSDCQITFASKSNFDTVGFIYDYDSYTYLNDYSQMEKSAIYYNDDIGNNLDFGITATLKAGKRYYLSTRFKRFSKTGSYQVILDSPCDVHSFTIKTLDEDFITGAREILELECTNCGTIILKSFIEAIDEKIECCDVNKDGYINAKDYAIILREEF